MIRRKKRSSLVCSSLPLMLIGLTIVCLFGYQQKLEISLTDAPVYVYEGWLEYSSDRKDTREENNIAPKMSYVSYQLRHTSLPDIPQSAVLLLYIGIFLFAEAAFILMAIKEYLQDLLGIDDIEEITEVPPLDTPKTDAD